MAAALPDRLPASTSLHGIIVALAVAGWYTEIRMDQGADDLRSIGLWIRKPYWKGMPTSDLGRHIGWFDHNSMPAIRGRMLGVYAQVRELETAFPDSVPDYNSATRSWSTCPHASSYLRRWQNGERTPFVPAPRNLPGGSAWPSDRPSYRDWLDGQQIRDSSRDENIASWMMGAPGDDGIRWSLFKLRFSALPDYGRSNDETWTWSGSIFSCAIATPLGEIGMAPGIKRNAVSRDAETVTFDEAIQAATSIIARAKTIRNDVMDGHANGQTGLEQWPDLVMRKALENRPSKSPSP